jgi:RHH-type proline utilization regulon transcriptional repressor/proline dehydrogenase/delta 1-pyrroline-5-carboxylate dehydrogenase
MSSLPHPPSASVAPFAGFEAELAPPSSALRAAVSAACRRDEHEAVQWLLSQPEPGEAARQAGDALARRLVQAVRAQRSHGFGVDALMHQFSLSSEEGIALMCLAEALLRIPDRQTADRLIADKISRGDWRGHLGRSPSLFVNAASWGLLITGRLVATRNERGLAAALTRLLAKGGEPLVRRGVDLAMRMLGQRFVAGRTIAEALEQGRAREARGYRHSYDMLGEAALTAADAAKYTAAYEQAIHAIGQASTAGGIRERAGISVKLSALHPRYARAQRERVMTELLPRLKALALLARRYQIGLNIDAEEADRLELSLDLVEALAQDAELAGFDGLGIVVQAYQKRCPFVIDWLADLARRSGRRFMVRLVKGAYWDAEIKRTQLDGMPDYPVYTRKAHTDLSYLVCADRLLAASELLYPQFATHNARTLAAVYARATELGVRDYEFQCLHGMGETLYDQVVGADRLGVPCRIYAPVGAHDTLLAYLVRRLLENGANSSFVNQIVDETIPVDALLADPRALARQTGGAPNPQIPLPADLYGSERRNSAGIDLSHEGSLRALARGIEPHAARQWQAHPLLAGEAASSHAVLQPVCNPADMRDRVGTVVQTSDEEAELALRAAVEHGPVWQNTPAAQRAALLRRAAELFERHRCELLALAVREAGKTLPNAVAELREAVDFLRYYAARAETLPAAPAWGAVLCISPWNFPLAIFAGQVSAALAAGNVVLAKPAEQTPLIAHRAVELLHQAGIPRAALQCLPGAGETVGAKLVADARVSGVLFTGSTEVAQAINRTLARRMRDEIREIALIAETGGQNAMIVDSSALPEQVVQDVLQSAFDSAGQRCSALRVLCLQDDIAQRTLDMLKGAMRELRLGMPDRLSTDVGPVIDREAQRHLREHVARMRAQAREVLELPLPADCAHGHFIAPTLIEIDALSQLQREVFGPVLHVLRYARDDLPELVDAINATGYGLTLGIHSRIDDTIDFIVQRAKVGNIYVNRNIVGAVVGVQPFGGEGKSGTGPKAGGPFYLRRLQRDAAPERGIAAAAAVSNAPLAALRDWAAGRRLQQLQELCERYAAASPLPTMLTLRGATGESNTLRLAPRGTVLCAATSVDALANQLAAVFATGNRACVPASDELPADFPALLLQAIDRLAPDELAQADLQFALVEDCLAADYLVPLAARDGALVPLLRTQGMQPIPLWRLLAERALSINTAAAGGNASLMSMDG